MKRFFSFLMVVSMLAACAHKPPRKPTGLKATDFWTDQTLRRTRIASVSSKLYLRYTAKTESVSGRGRLVAQQPGRLRLELRDPLGRTQYLVGLDGDDFVAYYPTQRRAYLDRQSGLAYVKKFLGFSCSFKDVYALLTGLVPPSAKIDRLDDWQWVDGAGIYRGRGTRGEDRIVVDVDPDTAAIRELTWESGRERASIVYGDFGDCCGEKAKKPMTLAHSASIKLEPFSSKIEAEWDDVARLDEPKSRDAFLPVLPENVQKIALP